MYGVDISHHNGLIYWTEVVKNTPKLDFIFMKASQGVGYVDSVLKYNSVEAKAVGIPVGYYHYASLNTHNIIEDARAEATFFVSTIQKCPETTLPLVLDIEDNKANLSPKEVLIWIKTFFAQLVALEHNNYMLYSYTPFLNSNLPKDHDLGTTSLWLAAYVNKATPKLPNGWSKYKIWQYSAKGKVKGIKGDVDQNRTELNTTSL
jgi:GH25 family lysozyme M1 (1,4-beta-N-acetylmuramidase)